MGSLYERELRAVLAGEPDGVRAVTRSCNPSEKARAMQVIRRPFLVVRAAGSGVGGAGAAVKVLRVKKRTEMRAMIVFMTSKRLGRFCHIRAPMPAKSFARLMTI